MIIDISIEGLMHASQTGEILKSGTRIMNISAEHPDVLCRLLPTPEMKDIVKEAVSHCREAHQMLVNSEDGTELTVDMAGRQVLAFGAGLTELGRWRTGRAAL